MSSAARPKPSAEEIAAQRLAKADAKAARKQAAASGKGKEENAAPLVAKKDSAAATASAPANAAKKEKTGSSSAAPATAGSAAASTASPARHSRPSQSLPSGAVSAAPTPTSPGPAAGPSFPVASSVPTSSSTSAAVRREAALPQPAAAVGVSRRVHDDPSKRRRYEKGAVVARTEAAKQIALFSHLPQYERETSLSLKVGFLTSDIPPPILRLGLQYTNGDITGSNARCVALLSALRTVIASHSTPANKTLRDDLTHRLKPWLRFLSDCRPLSVSMGNAIRYLKHKIGKLSPTLDEAEARRQLLAEIDGFVRGRILLADELIVKEAVRRIGDGDVVMTFASSHVVQRALSTAWTEGKRFSVVVVDSRPRLEAQALLASLSELGVPCQYTLISCVSSVMPSVSCLLLGASAMLSNGALVSRCGTAVVSAIAHRLHVPVLVLCETYKFTDRVQLDAICNNELADPDELLRGREGAAAGGLDGWRDVAGLKLLNLVYDVTPVEFVTMVVTEVGNVPATSVPVILREYHSEDGGEFE